MIELVAQGPLPERGPLAHDGCQLAVMPPVARWSVAPLAGQSRAVAAALKQAFGLTWPEPGETVQSGGARCIWWGHGQAMLEGTPDPRRLLAGLAAATDQSDAWVGLELIGDAVAQVMARLCEPDLRPKACPPGRVLRTGVRQLMVAVVAVPGGVQLFAMRSFADTLWDEVATAMESLAARRRIPGQG